MKKLYATLLLLTSFVSFAQLQLPPLPDYAVCDDEVADGFTTFDLGNISQMLYMSYPADEFTVAFYVNTAATQSDTRLPLVYTNVAPDIQTLVVKVWETENADNFGFTQLTLNVQPVPVASSATLSRCSESDLGWPFIANFDLTAAYTDIVGGQTNVGYIVTYYESMDDLAAGNSIAAPTNYTASGISSTIYVQVQNMEGCTSTATLQLNINPLPYIGELPVINSCPLVNLTQNVQAFAAYTASYHTTQADAYAGVGAIVNPAQYTAMASGSVWVRVSSPVTGCFTVVEQAYIISLTIEMDIIQNGNAITIDTNGRTDVFTFTMVSAPPS